MLQFKDLKQGYPVFILDKQEISVTQGKVTQVSFPHIDINQNVCKTGMVVDITVEYNSKSATYVIPENVSITYSGNLVLSTEKQGLVSEVEAMKNSAEQIIASANNARTVLDKAPLLLAELNPMYKERQETEQRFAKMESSISEMKDLISNFIKEFKG